MGERWKLYVRKITGRGRFSRLFTGEKCLQREKARQASPPDAYSTMVREKGGGAGEGGSHSEWKFSMNFYNAKPDNRRRNDTRFKAHLLYKIIFDIAASKRKYTKRFSTDLENSIRYFDRPPLGSHFFFALIN